MQQPAHIVMLGHAYIDQVHDVLGERLGVANGAPANRLQRALERGHRPAPAAIVNETRVKRGVCDHCGVG